LTKNCISPTTTEIEIVSIFRGFSFFLRIQIFPFLLLCVESSLLKYQEATPAITFLLAS